MKAGVVVGLFVMSVVGFSTVEGYSASACSAAVSVLATTLSVGTWSESVDAYDAVLDVCEGSSDWQAATQPPANPQFLVGGYCPVRVAGFVATFEVTIAVGTVSQTAPDAGGAALAMGGSNAAPNALFDGTGAVGGVLSDSSGGWKFPKFRNVLLPGNAGGAEVECSDGLPSLPCDGSGWARLLLDGTRYEVHGDAVGTC